MRLRWTNDPQEAHAIYPLLRLLTFSLDVPLAFIALASGALLALTSKWGILRYWWVTTKLAILLTTIVLGATLIGPSITTMLDVTETRDPGDSSVRWRLVAVASVQVMLLLGAATLGVFKPRGRVELPRLTRRPALDRFHPDDFALDLSRPQPPRRPSPLKSRPDLNPPWRLDELLGHSPPPASSASPTPSARSGSLAA